MKKITLPFLFLIFLNLTGCKNKYNYVETYTDTEYLSGKLVSKKDDSKSIEAENDSIAYLEGYLQFLLSLKVTEDMRRNYSDYTKQPVSFNIYNGKGVDISIGKSYPVAQDSIFNLVFKSNSDHLIKNETKPSITLDSNILNSLKAKFRTTKDEFSNDNLVWYYHKSTPLYTNENGIYCYFATVNGVAQNLRFKVQYTADSWLFFKSIFFSIDQKAYAYTPLEVKRDNGASGIWEWSDESANASDIKAILSALANSNTAKMKLQGDKYNEVRAISKKQAEAIKETIYLYNMLGGNF